MADVLVASLAQLHQLLSVDDQSRHNQATSVVQDIFNHALTVSSNESTYISSLLFGNETGILKFLKSATGFKEFEAVKGDILRFLAEYLKKDDIKSNALYVKLIKDVCVSSYTCDLSNKVKAECANVLHQLLMLDIDVLENELDIQKLFDRFWSECLNCSRGSGKAGLKCAIYSLMGGFSEMYPEVVGAQASRLLSLYLGSLKQEMVVKKSKVELQVITGCFLGLTGYLVNFTQSIEEGSKYANDIFNYVKLCIISQDYKRYDAPKAALYLLKRHGCQFKELITNQAEKIYEALQVWCCHINRDMKFLAIETTDAVLMQICIYISAEGHIVQHQGILKNFMSKFHKTLQSSSATTKEILIAVKGYGKFAEACSKVFQQSEMRLMFEEILKRSEQCYLCLDASQDESFYQLPTFLESLANIIKYLEELSMSYLYPLEKLVILLFDFYPRLGAKGQHIYHKSLTAFIEALFSYQSLFKTCLSQMVYQCLIRTCSYPLHIEKLLDEPDDLSRESKLEVSYKTFLPVWKALLDSKNYRVSNYDLSEKPVYIKEQVYDEIMQSILSILQKLNLVTENNEHKDNVDETLFINNEVINQSMTAPSEGSGLKALVPNDFTILVNLVEFCNMSQEFSSHSFLMLMSLKVFKKIDLLTTSSMKLFAKWVKIFVDNILLFSTRNPLVSGFYKFLQIINQLIEEINYFDGYCKDDKDIIKDKHVVYALLKSFIKEVHPHTKQYSGDLLISCVKFMITLPIQLVKCSLQLLVQPLTVTFEIGLSHLELAELGLNVLEKLHKCLCKIEMEVILTNILPKLDDYLQSSSAESLGNYEEEHDKITQTKSERKVKRTSVRYLKALIDASNQTVESPLVKLKLKIINFLGLLGGASNIAILHNSSSSNLSKAIRWDTEEYLLFPLPFQDIKPEIYLDSYLARVVELALTSSNRQTKVVACEFLHALVLYMLGIGVQKSYERNKKVGCMTKLYEKVFPAIIKLACSVEQVAEQLFRPLVFQIIHWLTGNIKYESPETIALLDSLLDGSTNSTDSSLRDFSALCVKEFLYWSIKQTSSKKLAQNPANPKSLFKRLKSLALHPNVYKRLGASVVMNNIYTVLREEESLVDVFILDLLILYIHSLSLAHKDEKSAGTITECEKVLQHLEKIIVKKSSMLYKVNKLRKIPVDFKNTSEFNLANVNIWILRQCGTLQTACRHNCMKLFHAFVPLQPGHISLKRWMENTLHGNQTGGAKFFSNKLERGSMNMGIRNFPTLQHVKESIQLRFSIESVITWLENLLGALDSYCWIFSANLLTPTQLFIGNSESNILKSMEYFLNTVSMATIHDVYEQYINDSTFVTPLVKENFNRVKCTVIVRMLNFLSLISAKGFWKENKILNHACHFNRHLYHVLFSCMFMPGDVGFNITDTEVLLNLPQEIQQFLNTMITHNNNNEMQHFQTFLNEKLSQKDFDILACLSFDLDGSGNANETNISSTRIVSGYMMLCKLRLMDPILSKDKCKEIINNIAFALCNKLIPLAGDDVMCINPTEKILANKYLELALMLDVSSKTFIEILLDIDDVKQGSVIKRRRGCIFYHLFSDIFNHHFVHQPMAFKLLLQQGTARSKNLSVVCNGVIQTCLKKDSESRDVKLVCKEIILCWSSIRTWLNSMDTFSQCLQLSSSILTLYKECLQSELFFEMIPSTLINSNIDMSSKEVIIEMLPNLLSICTINQTIAIKEALQKVIMTHFPIKSTDLNIGSSKYIAYMTFLNKFLNSMVASASPIIFQVLTSVFIQETESVFEQTIAPKLIVFIKSLSLTDLATVFEHCLQLFGDHELYTVQMRQSIIERVCLPALHKLNSLQLKEFYKCYVKKLMGIIESRLNKSNEKVLENQLVDQICAYKMMSLLFELLGKDSVSSVTSDILKAYCSNPSTGKELTSALSRCASSAFKEDMRGETLCLELRRKFHCAAYNCLVAIISCTQNDLKFYTGLLFADNPAKALFMFENLIDINKEYQFECELSAFFTKKKTLQLIRKATDENNKIEHGVISKPNGAAGYISSQYLMGSSFSQDVNQFDFNSPIEAHSNYGNPSNDEDGDDMMSYDKTTEYSNQATATVIEMDSLNQHECMPVFVAVINHMKDKKIYSAPRIQGDNEMPSWMLFLHKKMNNKDTLLNVKLFLSKLVVNMPVVFEPYGQHWFQPLTDLILSNQIPGSKLNYFVVDIIVVMLSWSATVVPENSTIGCNLSSSLLDYLFKYCHHSNRAILKNNLQVIKTMLNAWKERLEISYKLIYDLFKSDASEAKDNSTGLQLLGLIQSAGFKPYSHQVGLSESTYFQDLSRNLSFKYKEVFATAAEVCSMALKYYNDENLSNDMVVTTIHDYLISFSRSSKDRFVICLYSMHLHYPAVVDRYVSQLLYCVVSLYGILKTQCLQCLAARVVYLKEEHLNIFHQIKGKELKSLLTHIDEDTQLAALKLISGVAVSLKESEIMDIIPHVSALKNSSCVKIRELMYDFFIWIYDEKSKGNAMETDDHITILCWTKESLLLGVNDSNTALSLKLLNFWLDESHLPLSTIDRLIEILRALYSSKTEKEFLSYSTNLMLQLTSLSPDYTRSMFDSGLDSEESFRNYHINFSWQKQNIAMTPLFVATQDGSQLNPSQSQSYGNRIIRATQKAFEFTQTLETNASLNWMNPSVQISPQSFTPASNSSLNSSLIGKQTSVGIDDSVSGAPNNQDTHDILKLKKRFLKDKYSRNLQFANMQIKRNKMRKAEKDRQLASRDRKVVMYRQYRSGELPDIKIKHSELIVPLQALSQLDNQIAKMLFSHLFTSILSTFPEKFTEDVMDKAYNDIQNSLDLMMQSSTMHCPTFINSILEVCYKNNQLKLDAQRVSTNSIISLQQPIGILLLEKQLLNNIDVGSKHKHLRMSSVRTDGMQSWLQLAQVYDSIKDFDNLRSIFANHISKVDITKNALAAEARNDYDTALSLYREASRKEDWEDSPVEEEEEYWDTARLRCYENLSMWTNLCDFTTQSMTDEGQTLDIFKIWKDEVLQDTYLPYYIKSNMKLLCQGKTNEIHEDFTKFIETSLKDNELKEHLQVRYSDDLALLNVLQDSYGNAQHYLNISKRTFLDEWSHLNKLVHTTRLSNLLRLQKVAEIEEFISLMMTSGYKDQNLVERLLTTWRGRLLDTKLHNATVWNDIILTRCAFIHKLKSKHPDNRTFVNLLDAAETNNILLIADVARKQSNFAVANQYLRDSAGIFSKNDGSDEHDALLLQWRYIYVKVHCDKVRLNHRDVKVNLKSLISSVGHLDKCREYASLCEDNMLKQHLLQYKVWRSMYSVMQMSDAAQQADNLLLLTKLSDMNDYTSGVDQCIERLHENSYNAINLALTKANEMNDPSLQLQSKIMMKMVVCCDERIKEHDKEEDTSDNTDLANVIIQNLLKAMKLNCTEARLRFPRLLQLVDKYPATRESFAAQSKEVPCWMYLSWVNQIIALLDKSSQSAVVPIIKQIARTYPQAIMYPLKVSGQQFVFTDGERRKKYEALMNHVSMDIAQSFVFALGQLTSPSIILKDYIEESRKAFNQREAAQLISLYKEISQKLLVADSQRNDDATSLTPGRFAKDFQKEYGKEFVNIVGKDGKKLAGMTEQDFILTESRLKKIWEKVKTKIHKGNLKDFSPWLSAFQMNNYPAKMEIPGQYTGNCKPMLEYHVNIASFDEKVLTMSSKQQPKRLTIRGDDEKDYKFLVKGGEDLRLDQRIEQIFKLMNVILKKDSSCNKRSLQLKTYKVIPMTQRVGLIEWVNNTKPYKEMFSDVMRKNEAGIDEKALKRYVKHLESFGAITKRNNYAPIFEKQIARDRMVKSFNEVLNMVPGDLLRRVFQSYSSSSEAYFMLRTHFIQSQSCMSVAHYILGIGDRHLSNTLIDTLTGAAVGIDFGYSFGSSTQLLIPELMPFRMTSQMINLSLPLKGSSPFKQCMMVVLSAFRKHASVLLSTMDIFITEPLLDWQDQAKKQAHTFGPSKDEGYSSTWYPKHKIEICRQKLKGINCAYITCNELRLNQAKSKSLNGYIMVTQGVSDHNIRKRLLDVAPAPDKYILTIEEQIDCLIDQATDPGILGRTYAGWCPWI